MGGEMLNPAAVEVTMVGKVTGVANMGSGEKAVAADSGGPLFGEGPGGPAAIGCLPLKDGYSATFRNIDTQKMKAKLMQLKVAGSESITVPAGKFDAYKLAKYDRDSKVNLRDVMFLVSPKPKDEEQAAVWKRLVDGTLESPDTWEVDSNPLKSDAPASWPGRPRASSGCFVDQNKTEPEGGAHVA